MSITRSMTTALVATGFAVATASAQPAQQAVPAGAAVELPGAPDSVFGAMRQQTMGPVRFFHVSKKITWPEMGGAIGEVMGKEAEARALAKIPSGGPMLFVYRDGGPGGVTLDIGQPVPEGIQPAGEATIRDLPPQRSVSLIYQGPLRDIGRATDELHRQRRAAKLPEPIEQREWYLRFEGDDNVDNITLIQQILAPDPAAPAVTEPASQAEPMRLVTVPPMRFFHVSGEARHGAVQQAYAALDPQIEQAIAEAGLTPGGRWSVYEGSDHPPKPFVVHTGVAVDAAAKPAGKARIIDLPEFRCGSAVYQGPVSGLGAAMEGLVKQMQAIGLEPNGEFREALFLWEGPESANNVMWFGMGYDAAD